MTFYIKQNDTSPVLQATLQDNNDNAIDLTSCSVRFHMRAIGSTTAKVDAAATITDATAGVVEYEWTDSDTDSTGTFHAEFEVTYPSTKVESFPNNGYFTIKITDDIS